MESLRPGDTVDRYQLIAPIGEGGQGSVWRAEDPLHRGATVALKLISPLLVPGAAIDRLRREARALAKLSHPSLPRCHAFFEDLQKDVLGFALDFIPGSSLAELMGSGELDGPAIEVFLARCADPSWWTQTIAFTAVQARRV